MDCHLPQRPKGLARWLTRYPASGFRRPVRLRGRTTQLTCRGGAGSVNPEEPMCRRGQVRRLDTLQGSQNTRVDWSAPQRLPLRILEEASMRYATVSAASYCGVDLHARTM